MLENQLFNKKNIYNIIVQQAFEASNNGTALEISLEHGVNPIEASVTNTTGSSVLYQVKILSLISDDSVNGQY